MVYGFVIDKTIDKSLNTDYGVDISGINIQVCTKPLINYYLLLSSRSLSLKVSCIRYST